MATTNTLGFDFEDRDVVDAALAAARGALQSVCVTQR
jgi:hypothetical protein